MYNQEPKFEQKLNNGLRKLGNGLGRASKGVFRATVRGVKRGTKSSAKGCLTWIIVIALVFFFISFISYFVTDENIGESQNLVDYGNTVTYDADGNVIIDSYSPANASCLEFYKILSRNKSTWQLYEDENGETILIRETDERAVSDYFKNDEDFILDPYFLYSLCDVVYSTTYVYPEGFLKPVAYNEEDYTLMDIKGEEDECLVVSHSLDDSDEILVNNVADYGLATVLVYEEKPREVTFDYSYISEIKMTEEGLKEVVYDEPEFHSEVISSSSETVLVKAITFSGDITYEYEETYSCKTNCTTGIGSESETYLKVDCGEVTETCYYALPSYGPQSEDRTIYSTSAEYLWDNYCQDGTYYLPTIDDAETGEPAVLDKNNPDFSLVKQTDYTYTKYKMRSADSGIYETFVRNSKRETNDKGTEYLYDYLSIYTTYAPRVERSYDTFRNFSSKPSQNSSFLLLNGGNDGGYNGSTGAYTSTALQNAKMIWDGCIQWGYSEKQASAILGNVYHESGFSFSSLEWENQIGHGICQWSFGRYDGDSNSLTNYANICGTEWTDEVTQIQFLCMEIDAVNNYSYASCQWGSSEKVIGNHGYSSSEAKALWVDEATDIGTLALIMCENWERPQVSNASERMATAEEFYTLFSGTAIEYEIAVVDPSSTGEVEIAEGSGSLAYSTSGFNDEDKQAFIDFYYAGEGTEDTEYFLYQRYLSSSEIEKVINMTNSFIEQTTITEQAQKGTDMNMWENGFLTNLAGKRNDRVTYFVTSNIDFILPTFSDVTMITSVFGERFIVNMPNASRQHKGMDMGASLNAPLMAVCSGQIIDVGYNGSAGNYIVLQTTTEEGQVLEFTYMHNNSVAVSVGEFVEKGTVISYNGSTGASSGPHCHLALKVDGVYYNPLLYCYGDSIESVPAINPETGTVEYISLSVGAESSLQTWDYCMYYDDATGEFVPSGLGELK